MPTGHRILLFREDEPSLRVTSIISRSANFASAKRFCIFEGIFSSTDVAFQQNFNAFKFPPRPWKPSNPKFSELSLWTELSFCIAFSFISNFDLPKPQPKRIGDSNFPPGPLPMWYRRTTKHKFTCHSTPPLPIEYYSLERTSRLYESLQSARAAPILHQQSDFEFWRVIFRPLTSLFSKIS